MFNIAHTLKEIHSLRILKIYVCENTLIYKYE